jgi:flagellin-like protein
MKKAISPMVATVLLIGFTIAVGAILSVWFTTFTRTQTAGVSGAGACAINPVDVEGIDLSNGILTYRIVNRGIHPVNFTTGSFSCGGPVGMNTSMAVLVNGSSVVIQTQDLSTLTPSVTCADTDKLKVEIILYGYCTDMTGGTKEVRCPAGACFG